ncbi:hypothetical protein Tco_0215076 [Tanacetum coccineum]
MGRDDLDFGDIPEIEGVEIPPFVCKMGKNKEAAREALAIDIYRRFSVREEERPLIETIAYCDKYKKILDEICIDKMKLNGEMTKEEKEAIIKVKGEALIETEDPGAFVISIRLEAKINLNALADTGFDKNVMPYHVYKELGITTIIVKFLILDMPIERDTPILVGRGLSKINLNTKESDNDDEEDYGIQRNSFRAPIYRPNPSKYLNYNDPLD